MICIFLFSGHFLQDFKIKVLKLADIREKCCVKTKILTFSTRDSKKLIAFFCFYELFCRISK